MTSKSCAIKKKLLFKYGITLYSQACPKSYHLSNCGGGVVEAKLSDTNPGLVRIRGGIEITKCVVGTGGLGQWSKAELRKSLMCVERSSWPQFPFSLPNQTSSCGSAAAIASHGVFELHREVREWYVSKKWRQLQLIWTILDNNIHIPLKNEWCRNEKMVNNVVNGYSARRSVGQICFQFGYFLEFRPTDSFSQSCHFEVLLLFLTVPLQHRVYLTSEPISLTQIPLCFAQFLLCFASNLRCAKSYALMKCKFRRQKPILLIDRNESVESATFLPMNRRQKSWISVSRLQRYH